MTFERPVQTTTQPIADGPFEATWSSLKRYEVPDWFRDAKFGLWAHWGPQCQPEAGDWYARHMYQEGHGQYRTHLAKYGHPSAFGFKDVIHQWKAERWEPAELVALYKRAGARYFFAMANHHDNLDLWASEHHAWNSTRVGPRRDVVGEWARAARANGLPFGVSVHAAHAWTWYEPAQGSDKNGPKAGVPYDGKLTAADGKGQWWDGLDPQQLYAQNHPLSARADDGGAIHGQWAWGNGASIPDAAYCQAFYDRTVDLIDQHKPELIYFDDTVLPLYPVSDAGLKIAAHFYNRNLGWTGGASAGVVFGKILDDDQKEALVWDVERGAPNRIEPRPWQTCTCIGGWHYDRSVLDRKRYKSAATVVHMLADIVSKNGNLLLNVPVRGDGTIDDQERAIVEGIGRWLAVNGEAIYGTRPWEVFGEGPAMEAAAPLSAQGFNEGRGKPFTAADVRFTASKDGGTVYAILLGRPDGSVAIQSLGTAAGLLDRPIDTVALLGSDDAVVWRQSDAALTIEAPGIAADVPAVAFIVQLR